ncbi:hypothetical protein [Microbacterium sp. H6]|uniref:hypothetical protein n=1 Tax=Microbacterium sp. H6 TaxID=421122 RepID=UPI000DE31DA3|nr:hypothetical protein [Microbacterium sp. H6]RBO73537.1 hypothetical protein DSP71_05110 [Microbacterium sp. H6]
MTTTPAKPQDRKAPARSKAPKPSEVLDAEQEAAELRAELLGDMPALRAPHRFRLGHKNDFENLTLDAAKSGAFDGNGDGDGMLEFDTSKPEDIERFQKFKAFVVSIDTWAESIAEDKEAYAEWAEGKTEEHFMALFIYYRDELGKSRSSAS